MIVKAEWCTIVVLGASLYQSSVLYIHWVKHFIMLAVCNPVIYELWMLKLNNTNFTTHCTYTEFRQRRDKHILKTSRIHNCGAIWRLLSYHKLHLLDCWISLWKPTVSHTVLKKLGWLSFQSQIKKMALYYAF